MYTNVCNNNNNNNHVNVVLQLVTPISLFTQCTRIDPIEEQTAKQNKTTISSQLDRQKQLEPTTT